jgi:flagellar hook assembly protein FlgD
VKRLGVIAFVALAGMTVAAFFVTQALKVSLPLINGFPAPVPSTINPIAGGTCRVRNPKGRLVPLSFRAMQISFYLQNQGDIVDVAIVDSAGQVVRTLPGSGRFLRVLRRRTFVWNGRERDGRIAPDGRYEVQVTLARQDRTVTIANSSGAVEYVTVQTRPPALGITSIRPREIAPAPEATTIRFAGNQGLRPRVLVLRLSSHGPPRLVKSFAATAVAGHSTWNGTVRGGRPAPPGRYLIALRLTDRTCQTITTPETAAGAPGAVVTVR